MWWNKRRRYDNMAENRIIAFRLLEFHEKPTFTVFDNK